MAIKLLTVKELSEKTGFAADTLYKWVAKRKIPYNKINGSIRFDEEKIDNWISRREVKQKQTA